MTTISRPNPDSGVLSLKTSRRTRFMRFLTTALPTFLPTVRPSLVQPRSFGRIINTRRRVTTRSPSFWTLRKFPRLRMRLDRGNPCGFTYLEPIVTVRRLRPFLRRRAKTRRPLAVAIRALNPCTLSRRVLCGLYVGFTMHLLHCSRFVVRDGRIKH